MEFPQTPPYSAKSTRRILFDSPFSDYGTDAHRSPELSPSPAQKSILDRLTSIGHQILHKDISEQRVRWMNERLDGLEAAMAAPESQSRSDLEDSGLFMDDDADGPPVDLNLRGLGLSSRAGEDSKDDLSDNSTHDVIMEELHNGTAWEEGTTLGDTEAVQNIDDVFFTPVKKSFPRLSRTKKTRETSPSITEEYMDEILTVISELRMRHEETKYLNSLMLEEIDVANEENLKLRNANDKLILDLHLDYSELLFLKVQLQTIEAHALPLEDEDSEFSFVHAIERLELDWRDVEKRFSSRMTSHQQSKPTEPLKTSSPEDLQEVLKKIKDAAPAAPSAHQTDKRLQPPGHILERLSRPSTRSNSRTRVKSREPVDSKAAEEAIEVPEPPEEETPKPRTSFWDALARAAGIVDYDELFADDDSEN